MKELRYLIIIPLFFAFQTKSKSQTSEFQWKKLTKDEIEITEYGNAPAVITYITGNMYFDTNPNGKNLFLIETKHVRMKILNEEGIKYAKVNFTYQDMNCERYSGENSYIFKGYTYNITKSGEIKKTRFKNKYLNHKDTVNCNILAEANFQDVKVGSIIEYKITTPTLKFIKPDAWEFQKEIPVIYSKFTARVPHYFKYSFIPKNIDDLFEQDTSYYDRVLNYRFRYGNRYYNTIIDLSGKEYSFVNKYIPPTYDPLTSERIKIHLKEARSEPGNYAWEQLTKALAITTWNDYQRRTPSQRKLLTYPPGYYFYYLPSWKELNENLLQSEHFGLATIKFWDCQSLIDSITQGSKTEIEKAKAIYLYVRKKMIWNGEYNMYADVSDGFLKRLYAKTGAKVKMNSVGDFFEEGEGSSSEINFVLMHLLNKAKIEVHPVLVNIKTNNPVDKDIPIREQFTSVIAAVYIDDQIILLDAVEEDSNFSQLSKKYPTDQMFVIKKEEYGWFDKIKELKHK